MRELISVERSRINMQRHVVLRSLGLEGAAKGCIRIRASWFKRVYECGHRDSRWFVLSIFGSVQKRFKRKKLCSSCTIRDLEKHAIFCRFCGSPILPGNSVTKIVIGKNTVVYSCLRPECPSIGGRVGRWTRNGFRSQRRLSLLA